MKEDQQKMLFVEDFSGRSGGRPVCLAIGMFDGVHLGHQALIGDMVARAEEVGGEATVLTFWPHPSVFFRAPQPIPMIFPPAARTEAIERLGVQRLIQLPFDRVLAEIPAEDFPRWLKTREPDLHTVYVGENWRFGQGRKGDAALLRKLGPEAGFAVVTRPRVGEQGGPISSSRVRENLVEGNVPTVNALLGFRYFFEGTVVPGRQLGRELGFPTLNLPWNYDLVPRWGVYGLWVSAGESRERWPAVANLGVRPTVAEAEVRPVLEVHLLAGDCPFGPGQFLRTEWSFFLREEKKFASLEALREQISRDREEAAKKFGLKKEG